MEVFHSVGKQPEDEWLNNLHREGDMEYAVLRSTWEEIPSGLVEVLTFSEEITSQCTGCLIVQGAWKEGRE